MKNNKSVYRINREKGIRNSSYIHPVARWGKRSFDVFFSFLGLCLLLPFCPFVMLVIYLDSPGPVFFRQMRTGMHDSQCVNLFMMIKFRTMHCDHEKLVIPQWTAEDDPRITRVGQVLRRWHIDELPQLWNVLMGDMSLVGPRPEQPGISHDLDDKLHFYGERMYCVLPGITGLAQINLPPDQKLSDVRKKLAYDHAYAIGLTHSIKWLVTDITILIKTITGLFNPKKHH
ncbi:UDP-N-acetylgalactosamine-undecaprenyl-phosphate N-acetylgalactosaminephosphotransferase [invertebrate metagenome]|uniref:UDP-N-acetylgalactosamine-undecaprenyl-phosphate N-acetylgalactosaminephosphotransferase n=1 Tax=invertebrate metagenome TaxID=1711999 RepID=A0A2H9TCE9_9ZZZZ